MQNEHDMPTEEERDFAFRMRPSGIEVSELSPRQGLPLLLQPESPKLNLGEWLESNVNYVESSLLTQGAILFRGFQIATAEALEEIVRYLTPVLVNYIEGSSPRIRITEKVYTSTEYPPEFDISLHNELSYAHKWPSKLFFLCLKAPKTGGETPIADSRKVFQSLDKTIRNRFMEKHVKYVRNLHSGRGIGLAWQTVFETESRAVVERYCHEGNIEFEWTKSGGLRTSQIRPAVVKHPKTGEAVWFNQADQWHPSNLPESTRTAMLSIVKEADLPINAYYGDGTPIESEMLDEVRRTYSQATIKFPWQEGDVLLLDNMLVAHGRCSYIGPRRIVLAMGGSINLNDVQVAEAN